MDSPIVMIKLGGSLLDWPEWPARLRAMLSGLSDRRVGLIVGGGRAVDVIRDLDRIYALDDDRAHHLALHALGTTARLAAALLPEARIVGDPAHLADAWAAGLLPIIDPAPFLNEIDSCEPVLPHTWDVTSDSIAARVASHLGAAELILLKSVPLPLDRTEANSGTGPDWSAAAALGLVDPEFPRFAAGIPCVRLLCLRDEQRHPCPG